MGVLVFYPIIVTFSYSMHKMKLTNPGDTVFVGFDNYMQILKSESFRYSLQNTLFLLLVVVLLTTVFGVIVALMPERGYQDIGASDGACNPSVGIASDCQWNYLAVYFSSGLRIYE